MIALLVEPKREQSEPTSRPAPPADLPCQPSIDVTHDSAEDFYRWRCDSSTARTASNSVAGTGQARQLASTLATLQTLPGMPPQRLHVGGHDLLQARAARHAAHAPSLSTYPAQPGATFSTGAYDALRSPTMNGHGHCTPSTHQSVSACRPVAATARFPASLGLSCCCGPPSTTP